MSRGFAMKRPPGAKYETKLAILLYGGLALVPLGFLATIAVYAGGTLRLVASRGEDVSMYLLRWVGPMVTLVGMIMAGSALYIGLRQARQPRKGEGQLFRVPNVVVIGKEAYDKQLRRLFEDWEFVESESPRFYVKFQFSDEEIREYETSLETFLICGEGSRGEALIQGRWVCGYTAQVAAPTSHPYAD
ncbi:MAG: hypothetical protein D8M22_04175 [Armatimonadetes bacterium]|nr:hypothetical protein [Armatimonadota bacterium]